MKMSKKNVTVTLALTVGLTYVSTVPQAAYAETSLKTIQDQKAAQQSLSKQVSGQQKALQAELDRMNQQQLDITGRISKVQEQINTTNDQILSLKNETKVIQKRIDNRKQLLNNRLVSMYKNGGSINIIDFLLGSKSFGDFIDRANVLNMIMVQDRKIINDQQNDRNAVQQKKQSAAKKQAENVAKLQELRKNLTDVATLQAQKKITASALDNRQANISKTLRTLSGAAVSQQNAQSSPAAGLAAQAGSSTGKSSSSGGNGNISSGSASSFNLSASVSSGGIAGILNYGNRFIGRSTYVWGAENPSSGQFDCSGFVQAAFAANGIRIGRTTWEQVKEGTPVSYSEAKPGDIVFFDTDGTNGHDGIYLGGGRFIGSQDSTGVAIVSMNNPYWKSHFSGVVRRILN